MSHCNRNAFLFPALEWEAGSKPPRSTLAGWQAVRGSGELSRGLRVELESKTEMKSPGNMSASSANSIRGKNRGARPMQTSRARARDRALAAGRGRGRGREGLLFVSSTHSVCEHTSSHQLTLDSLVNRFYSFKAKRWNFGKLKVLK